ncbi:MAG: EthD domain-containing protein [Rhodospirillales bacterium]|nr:MAG: EthD domain-containing protein [Rhodospirillales bacterium]
MASVIKRFSMLRRHPALTREIFSRHYLEVHGPLAAAQTGFQRFAYRYDQNHVEGDLLGDDDPPFTGVTVTFQVPRTDYRQGFFQHPDYANVRPDEERLFDMSRTVSVLAEETVVVAGEGAAKAIIACRSGTPRAPEDHAMVGPLPGCIRKLVRNDLDTASASALGLGRAAVEYGRIWEVWFDSPEARARCLSEEPLMSLVCRGDPNEVLVALAVREVTIFQRGFP